ncbi:MAG: hypothetical protein KDD69_13435 [Bdellovibrionales bacterium]|nr:hypothetical protein [Bdellovibrionales bacterium]
MSKSCTESPAVLHLACFQWLFQPQTHSQLTRVTSSDRKKLKSQYAGLYERVSQILFSHDLKALDSGDNSDEYESEVGTILPRLRHAANPDEVARIVFEEFAKWFDSDSPPLDAFEKSARDIWDAWLEFKQRT